MPEATRTSAGFPFGTTAVCTVGIVTLAAEVLVELRRGPFFPSVHRNFFSLSSAPETTAAVLAGVTAHLGVIYCLFELVRLRRSSKDPRVVWDFASAVGILWLGVLAAKSRLIGFFSDRMDFDIARELAGGTISAAVLYAADEAMILVVLCGPALLLWWMLRRLISPLKGAATTGTPIWLPLLFSASVVAALFWASTLPAAEHQLRRFTAPWLLLTGLDWVTDLDGDGYGAFASPADSAPLDPYRYPMALDVPGNGIDEDGFGGDLTLPPGVPQLRPTFHGARRHVVLVVMESTRADAIGKRWGNRLVAPNLTALAAAGSAAPEAFSNFGMTARSLKSMFTGNVLASPESGSLFKDFRSSGYRVGIFSSQSEDFAGIAEAVGMRESAHVFVDAQAIAAASGRSGSVARTVADGKQLLAAMDRHANPRAWSGPTFLYFNFQAPHYPYSAAETPQILPGRPMSRSEISLANRSLVVRNYWNSVAYADWLLGQVLARLRSAGVYDDTVVVVVGDHGEELFERGYIGHGTALNATQTQVPLVFSKPTTFPRPTGLEDLRALILRAAGADVPAPADEPVLQILSYFARPSLIGRVETGKRWTTFSPRTGQVWSEDSGSADYASLPADSALRHKVDALVTSWMATRWQQHKRAMAACTAQWSVGRDGAFEVDRSRVCKQD